MPGDAHGSDMLGVINPPFANEVSSPVSAFRSIKVT